MNPDRKGGAVITHGDSIEGIVGDLSNEMNTNMPQFLKDVGRRAAPAVAFLREHPEVIQQARQDVDTFKPYAVNRMQEGMEKSDKFRGVHLGESIEQAQQNLPIEKTTAGDVNLMNRNELMTLGQEVKLPQFGSWARIPEWLPEGRDDPSNEQVGREYLLSKQAAGNTRGPESEFLQYREAVQKDVGAWRSSRSRKIGARISRRNSSTYRTSVARACTTPNRNLRREIFPKRRGSCGRFWRR